MNTPLYTLGISPCPNDTFIFDALIHRRTEAPFTVQPHMADVEELNALASRGTLEITKLSLAAASKVLDRYMLLNSGAALGRGCGPLVVSRAGVRHSTHKHCSIAIPGRLTTANLLLSLTGSFQGPRQEMVFDRIIPAVQSGKADLGVIIHEGRFTYAEHGLELVLDLGEWWERHTGLPLPLGVIAVRRDLGRQAALQIQQAIHRSLEHARAHPADGEAFIREHAQEMDPAVMAAHIRTFVNDFSLDLGEEGRRAVLDLLRAARKETGEALPEAAALLPEQVFAPEA